MELADAPGGKDVDGAITWFEKACDQEYFDGCWAAGDLYHTRKKDAKAKPLLTKACDGKHEKACALLLTIK